jgi:2-oxoglutarate dehydrogenase E1 component
MPTNTPAQPKPAKPSKTAPQSTTDASADTRETTFDIFRRWGYLQATLDPLGQFLAPEPFPTPAPDGQDSEEARRYYCGSIGTEFMHIPSPEKRAWIQERLERASEPVDSARILTGLIRGDLFEQVIQQRYLGTKRFSPRTKSSPSSKT